MKHSLRQDDAAVWDYVAAMAQQLARMASASQRHNLAYILEVAALEARTAAGQHSDCAESEADDGYRYH